VSRRVQSDPADDIFVALFIRSDVPRIDSFAKRMTGSHLKSERGRQVEQDD